MPYSCKKLGSSCRLRLKYLLNNRRLQVRNPLKTRVRVQETRDLLYFIIERLQDPQRFFFLNPIYLLHQRLSGIPNNAKKKDYGFTIEIMFLGVFGAPCLECDFVEKDCFEKQNHGMEPRLMRTQVLQTCQSEIKYRDPAYHKEPVTLLPLGKQWTVFRKNKSCTTGNLLLFLE